MKIQLLSDLHCEFFNSPSHYLAAVKISPEADVIVLPGDIASGNQAIEYASNLYNEFGKPIVFTPGNHEFYRQNIDTLVKSYRKKVEGVHVLLGINFLDLQEEETYVDIGSVRFLGGTFWTNFKLYENSGRIPTQEMAMRIGSQGIRDFQVIEKNEGYFTPQDSVNYFNDCYNLVDKVLAKPFEGKKVLVSHHGLHKNSIHTKYSAQERQLASNFRLPNENTGWMINPAFASHCPELLEKVDIHLHGHTHSSLDYRVGKCRVVTNPRGYPINQGGNLVFENSDFEEMKLIII